MASAGARAYNGGLGAFWHFNTEEGKFGTHFEVKRLKRGTEYACEQETNVNKLTHSK